MRLLVCECAWIRSQAGHQPQVRVWELARLVPLAELKGHDFAVRCVSFSPNAKFVVSVGNQFDHVRCRYVALRLKCYSPRY